MLGKQAALTTGITAAVSLAEMLGQMPRKAAALTTGITGSCVASYCGHGDQTTTFIVPAWSQLITIP